MEILGFLLVIVVFLSLMFLMNYSVFSVFFKSRKVAVLVSLGSVFFILGGMILSNVFGGLVVGYFRLFVNFYIGAIFIFFVLSLLFRLANLYLKIDSKYFGISLFVVGLVVVVFSMFNSIGFENNDYVIESSKLDRDYKIVHISDIHIGSNSADSLVKIVDYINSLEGVDAVFLTGDLIDENVVFEDLSALNDLKVVTYFVYGNHEFYVREDSFKDILLRLNMVVLRSASVDFDGLQIIGFDDDIDLREGFESVAVRDNSYTILMYHKPLQVDVAKNSGVDLMLSGHTHAGQIWPFGYLVRLQFRYIDGLYDLDGMYLNVNPGTGTWGPKMRLGSKNEISVIELKKR